MTQIDLLLACIYPQICSAAAMELAAMQVWSSPGTDLVRLCSEVIIILHSQTAPCLDTRQASSSVTLDYLATRLGYDCLMKPQKVETVGHSKCIAEGYLGRMSLGISY